MPLQKHARAVWHERANAPHLLNGHEGITVGSIQVEAHVDLDVVLGDFVYKHAAVQLVHDARVAAHDASDVLGDCIGLCANTRERVCVCVLI